MTIFLIIDLLVLIVIYLPCRLLVEAIKTFNILKINLLTSLMICLYLLLQLLLLLKQSLCLRCSQSLKNWVLVTCHNSVWVSHRGHVLHHTLELLLVCQIGIGCLVWILRPLKALSAILLHWHLTCIWYRILSIWKNFIQSTLLILIGNSS